MEQQNNCIIVANTLNETLCEISELLGNDDPKNWTKDNILNRIKELQVQAVDQHKKSNQVKKLNQKLKVKAKTSVSKDLILKLLDDNLKATQFSYDSLNRYSDDKEFCELEGQVNHMKMLIQTVKQSIY